MPSQLKNHHGAMEAKPPAPAPPAVARVSRFRRLLVRVSASERLAGDGREREKEEKPTGAGAGGELEAGSVELDRMVLSFMEDAAVERPPRGRCNCFNGSNYDGSDDEEFDFLPSESSPAPAPAASGDTLEALKGLVQSASVAERNLLADASKVAEKCGKSSKNKADCRRSVADGLRALGYDAAVCKSRWEKGASYPAGEHEYIDAVVEVAEGEREVWLIVELDFRSEFELARSTKAYRAALQALPPLFVGTPDRLGQIVAVVAEAARHSLKKKGLHFPPWRKPEYMRAKWLSPHVRCPDKDKPAAAAAAGSTPVSAASFSGEFELRFDGRGSGDADGGERITVVVSPWRPVEPEASKKKPPPQQQPKTKVVTGLASVL